MNEDVIVPPGYGPVDDGATAPTVAGFDFADMMPASRTPPFVTPQPPKRGVFRNPRDRQQAMKLAIMLPMAMKAGPGAVTGLLQGFANAEQQQYTRGRQEQIDQRAQSAADWQQQYQQGQLRNQQLQQQQQFMDAFRRGLSDLDTPEAIDSYLQLQSRLGQAYGVPEDALTSVAAPFREPSRLQRRAADAYVKRLKDQYGQDWMQTAGSFTHRVGNESLTLDQLLERTGQTRDPNAPVPEPKTNGVEDAAIADAIATAEAEKGLKLTPQERQAVRLQAVQALAEHRRVQPATPAPKRPTAREESRAIDTARGQLELALSNGQNPPSAALRKLSSFNLDPQVEIAHARQRVADRKAREARNARNAGDDDAVTPPAPTPNPAAGRGRGAGPRAGGAANGGQPRTATRSDVQAVAQRLGITEADARRRLEAAGVVVR